MLAWRDFRYLARSEGLALVVVFGSAARGVDHPRDLDLGTLHSTLKHSIPDWKAYLADLTAHLSGPTT
ncbi:hypothetical protein DYH09_12645 [bacterium CPR1]|nr:hypothetical protein [bacterium CPR1]